MLTILTENLTFINITYSILFILALSSLNVYGIIIQGSANVIKYDHLGVLRSASQMISYEITIVLVLLPVIFFSKSLNFLNIAVNQYKTLDFLFPALPLVIVLFISILAETNRAP